MVFWRSLISRRDVCVCRRVSKDRRFFFFFSSSSSCPRSFRGSTLEDSNEGARATTPPPQSPVPPCPPTANRCLPTASGNASTSTTIPTTATPTVTAGTFPIGRAPANLPSRSRWTVTAAATRFAGRGASGVSRRRPHRRRNNDRVRETRRRTAGSDRIRFTGFGRTEGRGSAYREERDLPARRRSRRRRRKAKRPISWNCGNAT